MSNVKGNDIDDLFKRASDQYPLRTDSADWNKLAADLDKDRSLIIPPANTEGGEKRKRRRFFWLFLLLPLGGIGYYAVHSSKQSRATVQHGASQTPAKAGGEGGNTPTNESGQKSTTPESGKNVPATESNGKTPVTTSTPSGTAASVGTASRKEATAVSPSGTAARETPHRGESNNRTNAYVLASHPPTGSGLAERQTINRQLTKRASTEGEITGKRKRKSLATEQPGSEEPGAVGRTATDASSNSRQTTPTSGIGKQTNGIPIGKAKQTNGISPGIVAQENATSSDLTLGNRNAGATRGERDLSLSALKSSRARTSGDIVLNIPVNAKPITVAAKDSSGSKKNIKKKKESFFYAGLIVAPDLSTIKMQSVKGVGTTFGVLLGYQFNRKWAVETGVYLDHKKYYTNGEYFKNGNSNGTYKILTVDGYCNMWEIPVNVRYNLSSGEKTKWFATAGMSTYLMTRENYVSKINASGWIYDSPWDIKKPSQYWFSVVNLSAGFEQKLGRIGNLRLEPYLRIPLKGMGTGSLPIMSAGLNIGITRKIW